MQAIKDIMTSQLPAIYAHTELTDIIEQLQSHGLFGAPVVDAQKQLIGFISEQQLLNPLLQNSYFCDGQITAQDLMSQDVLAVKSNMLVVDLATQMQGDKPKIYPVVENNKVIGLVTRSRVINALKQAYLSCAKAS
ncbi:CBS domain-containing protein [Pseudoalteromonas phenolica]|uniref:CBS domain-containing protein n=1 Tax=Pseudoalteromonas phenolica TaxID=161398 RepID=UPI00110A8EC0|nr:CBS domain-containing protein [Pseudoalteromonas phenolica]TMO53535.1 CBS domain-containing protein [Pseudoalteromonas phenolica]